MKFRILITLRQTFGPTPVFSCAHIYFIRNSPWGNSRRRLCSSVNGCTYCISVLPLASLIYFYTHRNKILHQHKVTTFTPFCMRITFNIGIIKSKDANTFFMLWSFQALQTFALVSNKIKTILMSYHNIYCKEEWRPKQTMWFWLDNACSNHVSWKAVDSIGCQDFRLLMVIWHPLLMILLLVKNQQPDILTFDISQS